MGYLCRVAVSTIVGNLDLSLVQFEINIAWCHLSRRIVISNSALNQIRVLQNGVDTILAGDKRGKAGYKDGVGTEALFNNPMGVVVDKTTGTITVIDNDNNRLRSIDMHGKVTTIAGKDKKGNPPVERDALESSLGHMRAIAQDSKRNLVFSSLSGKTNYLLRLLSSSGKLEILNVEFGSHRFLNFNPVIAVNEKQIEGIAIDSKDNIYVSRRNHTICRLNRDKKFQVVAGVPGKCDFTNNTPALQSLFNDPFGIAFDHEDNLIICDHNNDCIRKLSSDGKLVSLLAGIPTNEKSPGTCKVKDGDALSADSNSKWAACFYCPYDVTVGDEGEIYVTQGNCVRMVFQEY